MQRDAWVKPGNRCAVSRAWAYRKVGRVAGGLSLDAVNPLFYFFFLPPPSPHSTHKVPRWFCRLLFARGIAGLQLLKVFPCMLVVSAGRNTLRK